ncbi:MAG: hypothetical protein AAB176_01315 [Pseudomonadota bacterium]
MALPLMASSVMGITGRYSGGWDAACSTPKWGQVVPEVGSGIG